MKIIALSNFGGVQVDDEDFEFLNQWSWYAKKGKGKKYYAARCARFGCRKVTIRMHRLVMVCPLGMTVDHIDRDTMNNQKHNLEVVTQSENTRRIHDTCR